MKRFLLFISIALIGIGASAQVRLGFGLGYAFPSGDIADFTDGGISGHFELGYAVTDRIDVSLLYQGDFLIGGSVTTDGETAEFDNVTLGSYLFNGRYYFKENGFRPYGSLGFGLTNVGALELEASEEDFDLSSGSSESSFALRPALGFKYGVLNFNVAYLTAGKVNEVSVSNVTVNLGLLFSIGGN